MVNLTHVMKIGLEDLSLWGVTLASAAEADNFKLSTDQPTGHPSRGLAPGKLNTATCKLLCISS